MKDWTGLLEQARPHFGAPSFHIFTDMLTGWVCVPGRRTITKMITVADPTQKRAHDAYHRFFRDGVWAMSGLWRILTLYIVAHHAQTGVIELLCDDTLFHKTGRKVNGAGIFRDAVRSTIKRIVYALGLNLVVITIRLQPAWGGTPIALPINVRLHKKKDTTSTVAHAADMMHEIASWLPGRDLHLTADGAYATLVGAGLPRTQVTSRMRRDAALYESAPPATGQPGRPRLKGDRLPTPTKLATNASGDDWENVTINQRGTTITRLVHVRDVLWYTVNKTALVRLVIVRDPDSIERDDFFVTSDRAVTGAETATRYAGRWPIEVCFRDVKQHLGGQNPQSWKRQGPERAAALSLWLHAAIWCWYLDTHPTGHTWISRAWYPGKKTPSFLDALAALRRVHWARRINTTSAETREHEKITATILDTLAYAA